MRTPEEILAKHGYPMPGDDLDPNLIHAMEEFVQECETNYSYYFWEDAHAKLEEKLRIQYDAEFEAFKVSFENRIRDEYEQKLNEAAHADASEITSLRKELDKRDESIKNLLRINETLNTVIKKISTGQIHNPSVYNDGLRANEIDLNSGQNVSFREEPRNSGWERMKTATEILKTKCPGIILFGLTNGQMDSVLMAMEEYAIQKLESTVASYEIDRINLVDITLQRDSWYGQFKALSQSHIEQGKEIHNLKAERKKIIEKNASMSIQQALNASKLKEAEERATHWYDLYTQQLKRKDQLEEWLQDYQESLRSTNVFHKNEATIHAITEILNESNI
jgi:hypothetical protein